MQTIEYTPLQDALQLLQTIGRRAQPGALIYESDGDIFQRNSHIVQALIRNDSQYLPFALVAIERLQSVGFQQHDPNDCFFYLLNCLTALHMDMPLHDSQLYELILFFSEFHSALQHESARDSAGFVASSLV
ncbi:MAG: hypothetical protein KA731_03255 [Candidatus Moranbacteria bacterium]|nr:hypothetical protein [Candidatus Moranbacteria bacterium]